MLNGGRDGGTNGGVGGGINDNLSDELSLGLSSETCDHLCNFSKEVSGGNNGEINDNLGSNFSGGVDHSTSLVANRNCVNDSTMVKYNHSNMDVHYNHVGCLNRINHNHAHPINSDHIQPENQPYQSRPPICHSTIASCHNDVMPRSSVYATMLHQPSSEPSTTLAQPRYEHLTAFSQPSFVCSTKFCQSKSLSTTNAFSYSPAYQLSTISTKNHLPMPSTQPEFSGVYNGNFQPYCSTMSSPQLHSMCFSQPFHSTTQPYYSSTSSRTSNSPQHLLSNKPNTAIPSATLSGCCTDSEDSAKNYMFANQFVGSTPPCYDPTTFSTIYSNLNDVYLSGNLKFNQHCSVSTKTQPTFSTTYSPSQSSLSSPSGSQPSFSTIPPHINQPCPTKLTLTKRASEKVKLQTRAILFVPIPLSKGVGGSRWIIGVD